MTHHYVRAWQKNSLTILGLLALFAVFALLTAFLYSDNPQHQFRDSTIVEKQMFEGAQNLNDVPSVYNSDLLMPYLIVQDALQDPKNLTRWTYSPALYIFPDWPIAAALVLLKIPNKLLPVFYSAAVFTALSLIIGALVSRLTHFSLHFAVAIPSAIICASGLLALAFPNGILSYYLFVWMGSAYIHSGALMMYLLASYCLLQLWGKNGSTTLYLSLLAFVIFITTLSDFIFAVWFVAPALVICALSYYLNREQFRLKYMLAIAAPAIAAIALESVLRNQSLQSRAHQSGSIALWFSDLYRFFSAGDYAMVMLVCLNVAILTRTIYLLINANQRRPFSNINLLEIFLGITCLFALVTPLAMNLYRGLALWRYSLVLAVLPVVWLSLFTGSQLKNIKFFNWFASVLFGLILATSFFVYPAAVQSINKLQTVTPLEACLLRNELKTGYSDYWSAKSLIFSTDRKIHTMQLVGIKPYHFAFNESWFSQRADKTEPFEPNFIILENLNLTEIAQTFGPPDRIIECEKKEIWHYDHTLPLPAALDQRR